MQVLFWLGLGIIICVAILVIQNSAAPPVGLKFLLWKFETSSIYALLEAAGIGMLFILLLWIPRAIRASSRAKKLKKEIELLQEQLKKQGEESKKKLPE